MNDGPPTPTSHDPELDVDLDKDLDAAILHAFSEDDPGPNPSSSPELPTLVTLASPAETPSTEMPLRDETVALVDATNRYRVVRELGRGGMGVVYSVHDARLEREVALKVLHRLPGRGRVRARRFVEEAQISGQLQHPGIVPVYDVGILQSDLPYFTMKAVKGSTLGAILAGRSHADHDISGLLGIFLKVCEAVAFAHARGVVHRDLKPSNVMVGDFGEVLVMDWGLAKVLDGNGERTFPEIHTVRRKTSGLTSVSGAVMGTPGFMSPEQEQGAIDTVGSPADVFSLGTILHQILTGEIPFRTRATDAAGLVTQEAVDAALKSLRIHAIDRDLVAIVSRALALEPSERFPHAGAMAQALQRHIDSLEQKAHDARISAAAAEARAHQERRVRRLTLALSLGALLALLTGGVGWAWHQSRVASRARTFDNAVAVAEREAERAAGESPQQLVCWITALHEFERALARGEAGELPTRRLDPVRKRVNDLRTAVQALRDQQTWEENLVSSLARIRVEISSSEEQDGQYAETLRRFGLQTNQEGIARVQGSPIAADVAAALDAWSSVRRRSALPTPLTWQTIIETAIAVDPDPDRTKIRRSVLESQAATLADMVRHPRFADLPVETQALAANALGKITGPKAAVETLLRSWSRHPDDVWINLYLSEWHSKTEPPDDAGALRHATVASGLKPEAPLVHINLGNIYLHIEDYSEAGRSYRRALDLDSSLFRVRFNLVLLESLQYHWDAAVEGYRKLLEERPTDPACLLNLGQALFAAGDLPGAEAAFQKALEAKSNNAQVLGNLALLHLKRADVKTAEIYTEQTLRADPNHAHGHYIRGLLAERRKDYVAAVTHGERARQLDPKESHTVLLLCRCYGVLGETAQVGKVLTEARAKNPKSPDILINLAIHMRKIGRPEDTLSLLLEAQPLSANTPWRPQLETFIKEAHTQITTERAVRAVIEKREPLYGDRWTHLPRYLRNIRHFLREARLWEIVLHDAPEKAKSLHYGEPARLRAVRAALLAADGQGNDAHDMHASLIQAWRSRAFEWLAAELDTWDEFLERNPSRIEEFLTTFEAPEFKLLRNPASLPQDLRDKAKALQAHITKLATAVRKPP